MSIRAWFTPRKRIVISAVFVIASLIVAIMGLFKLTAITMSLTFLLGIPLMGVGLLLYLSVVIQDLTSRKVL